MERKLFNIVRPREGKDGKTFYRVRVIDLPNRDSAEKIARQLEIQYGLSKLWIGKQ